jgi:REP-associated tyrosine transposase
MKTSAHAAFELRFHLVLVTKYRRKVLTAPMLEHAREVLAGVLKAWRC